MFDPIPSIAECIRFPPLLIWVVAVLTDADKESVAFTLDAGAEGAKGVLKEVLNDPFESKKSFRLLVI